MKLTVKYLQIIALLLAVSCTSAPSVLWIEGETRDDGKAVNEIVFKNIPSGSQVWFARIPRSYAMAADAPAEIKFYKGNSHYIDIPEYEGNELRIKYITDPLPRRSWAPEGFATATGEIKADYKFLENKSWTEPGPEWFAGSYEPKDADIIPAVKEVVYGEELIAKPEFEQARITLSEGSGRPEGWYQIEIGREGASIEASDEDGLHYASVTYDLLPKELHSLKITDWPDLYYRGIMLDVARNFIYKDEVLTIIDLLSRYKINYLHLHLVDDEGWRLEIPELPELTSFGSVHAIPDNGRETKGLMPGTDGRISPESRGSGFYTREDFKEILSYAWQRRIRVIPEFDAPGHSRAAIRSMMLREELTGDDSYRLWNPADSSKYMSPQSFDDNVLEVEYPGVYKFMECIFDNVIGLYSEAGVPLPAIHIGGDEVPHGAWSGRSRVEMKDLFIRRMMDLAGRKGVLLAGWQEITQGIKPETAELLKPMLFGVNAWDTNESHDEIPYRLAGEGYKTILSNVGNLYIDLAYSDGPYETGLHWGGYVDERKSFALQPFNIYESLRWKGVDTPLPLQDASKGKAALTKPENIIGVQVQLWSENLRSFGDFTYNIFPKAIGAFERGWNARPDWSGDEAFKSDFDRFYSILAKKEFPIYEERGIRYKSR